MDIYDFLLTARPKLIYPDRLIYDEHTLEFIGYRWIFDPGTQDIIVDKNWYDIALKLAQYPERIEDVHIKKDDVIVCRNIIRPSLFMKVGTRVDVVGTDYEVNYDVPTWRMLIHVSLFGSPIEIFLRDVLEVWRDGNLFYSLREFPE